MADKTDNKESQWAKKVAALNPGETLCIYSQAADAAIQITANQSSWQAVEATASDPTDILTSAHPLTLQAVKDFVAQADPDSWPDAKTADSLESLSQAATQATQATQSSTKKAATKAKAADSDSSNH